MLTGYCCFEDVFFELADGIWQSQSDFNNRYLLWEVRIRSERCLATHRFFGEVDTERAFPRSRSSRMKACVVRSGVQGVAGPIPPPNGLTVGLRNCAARALCWLGAHRSDHVRRTP